MIGAAVVMALTPDAWPM